MVRSPARAALQARLSERGVGTLIHYPVPPHRQPAYAGLGIPKGRLPISERLAGEVLSLPIGPHLDDAGRAEVVGALRAALRP